MNCPKGAREATLGCGPKGPRNDMESKGFFAGRRGAGPYNFPSAAADDRKEKASLQIQRLDGIKGLGLVGHRADLLAIHPVFGIVAE